MRVLRLVFLFPIAFSFGQTPEDLTRRREEAERQIVRLPPSAFPELPRNLIGELQRRRCTIPQASHSHRHNVVRGEFAKPRQTDWAVLCSMNGTSSILIFWKGATKNPAEIVRGKDIDYLVGDGEDPIVYTRDISSVGQAYVMEHFRAYGGPTPPPLDHQGVNDSFLEKASIVHYFFGGRWLQLQGAD